MFTNVGCVTIFVHYIHLEHTHKYNIANVNSDGKMVCAKCAPQLNAFDVNSTGYIWCAPVVCVQFWW